MKSLILSVTMMIILIVAATILFKCMRTQRRALLLLGVFTLTLPAYVVIFLATPPDLGFLPKELTDSNHGFALGLGLFIHTAFFGGGTLQLYNLADRGFSLRILIDIIESPTHELTLEEILKNYGGGKGIDWMYQKRMEGMLENQLVIMQAGDVQITDKGLKIAGYFSWMRKFLNLEVDSSEEAR